MSLVNSFLFYGFILAPAVTLVREGYRNISEAFWFVPSSCLFIGIFMVIKVNAGESEFWQVVAVTIITLFLSVLLLSLGEALGKGKQTKATTP